MQEPVPAKVLVFCLVWGCAAASGFGIEFPGRRWERLNSPADAGWSVEALTEAREYPLKS